MHLRETICWRQSNGGRGGGTYGRGDKKIWSGGGWRGVGVMVTSATVPWHGQSGCEPTAVAVAARLCMIWEREERSRWL
jgi:hypothetical protein